MPRKAKKTGNKNSFDKKTLIKSKTTSAKFKTISINDRTFSIGVEIAQNRFASLDALQALVTCAELRVKLVVDPAAADSEPDEQATMLDTAESISFIARTARTSMDLETVTFTLQASLKEFHAESLALCSYANKHGKITMTKIGQSEQEAA